MYAWFKDLYWLICWCKSFVFVPIKKMSSNQHGNTTTTTDLSARRSPTPQHGFSFFDSISYRWNSLFQNQKNKFHIEEEEEEEGSAFIKVCSSFSTGSPFICLFWWWVLWSLIFLIKTYIGWLWKNKSLASISSSRNSFVVNG